MALFFVRSWIIRQKLNFVAVEALSCKTLQYTVIVLYSQARDVKPQHANATRLHGNVTLLLNIYLATIEIPTLLSPSSPAKATKDGGIFLIPPSCNMVVFKLLSLESIFVTTPNLRQDMYIFARLIVRQQQISCGSIIRQASSVSPVYCCTVLVTESVWKAIRTKSTTRPCSDTCCRNLGVPGVHYSILNLVKRVITAQIMIRLYDLSNNESATTKRLESTNDQIMIRLWLGQHRERPTKRLLSGNHSLMTWATTAESATTKIRRCCEILSCCLRDMDCTRIRSQWLRMADIEHTNREQR